jgi:hypothetical protein
MRTARGLFTRWVILAIAGWSVLVLLFQTFKGANVGNPACIKDPYCGEVGWVPVAAWVAGIVLIVLVAYLWRRRHPQR